MAGPGERTIPAGAAERVLDGGVPTKSGATVMREVIAELGLERCSACGSIVIEGSCVKCQSETASPAASVSRMGRSTGASCARCSVIVVTGASFCGFCGEPVHASTLSLARVREMRARLETLR